jgi:PAS domain-containing protein
MTLEDTMLERTYHQTGWSPGDVSIPRLTENGDVSTHTIDLSSLYKSDVQETGSFDLGSIESSSLGSLLNALPIPAFLIDSYYSVAFANQACRKITLDWQQMRGVRFADLLPVPDDAGKAETLARKAQSILERAFQTRKPQRAEAILKISGNKIWCRLHIRSVRLVADRYLLVLIEDLTSDRTEQRLRQREEVRLRQAFDKMEMVLKQRNSDLNESEERLREEALHMERAKELLLREKRNFRALFQFVPIGMILIGNDGTVRDANPKFLEMFGYIPDDLPFPAEWLGTTFGQALQDGMNSSNGAEAIQTFASKDTEPLAVRATTKEGSERSTVLRPMRLGMGDFVVICEDASEGSGT